MTTTAGAVATVNASMNSDDNIIRRNPKKKPLYKEVKLDESESSRASGWYANMHLQKITEYGAKIADFISDHDEVEPWIFAKLAQMSESLDEISHHLEYVQDTRSDEFQQAAINSAINDDDVQEVYESFTNEEHAVYAQLRKKAQESIQESFNVLYETPEGEKKKIRLSSTSVELVEEKFKSIRPTAKVVAIKKL